MISVENFYWMLWENLFRATGFCNSYYYPFGSRSSVVKEMYGNRPQSRHGHVLHFDQEPMYASDAYSISQASEFNRLKYPRLLANSEHSAIKREICKDLDLLDWYYFYHGFAALDWYRDGARINNDIGVTSKFLCLNNLIDGKRSHRMSLLARLISNDLLLHGTVSFHGDQVQCQQEVADPASYLDVRDKDLVCQTMCHNTLLPLRVDYNVGATCSAHFGVQEYRMRQQSFLHVVTESVYFDPKLHLTEKIFQPIVTARPFILVAAPGNLAYLKSYGFRTFDTWIDETYDQEQDNSKRLDMITVQISQICARPLWQLRDMLEDMTETLQFNKQHFYTGFRHLIIDELVDNFDACIKIWNNGRVRYQWPRLQKIEDLKDNLKGNSYFP
jgi:hypothetical protein